MKRAALLGHTDLDWIVSKFGLERAGYAVSTLSSKTLRTGNYQLNGKNTLRDVDLPGFSTSDQNSQVAQRGKFHSSTTNDESERL